MTYISRLISLKGFGNTIIGRDLGKALDEGVVYGIQNVMGVITLVPIGEAVIPDQRQQTSNIIMDGKHYLTKNEYRKQLISENFLDEKEIERYINGTSSNYGI